MSQTDSITRVAPGETLTQQELIARLAYQLQLPAAVYGKRLYKAYKAVVEDALMHGEGINLGVAVIKVKEFNSRVIPEGAFGAGMKRDRMYRYDLSVTADGKEALTALTKEVFDDI